MYRTIHNSQQLKQLLLREMGDKIKFSEGQLKGMVISPMEKEPYARYPQLSEHLPGRDPKLIAFLAWVYDPQSPLVRQYPDCHLRMSQARTQSGFLDTYEPKDVNVWVRHIVRSRLWRAILATEFMYEENLDEINTPISTGRVGNGEDGERPAATMDDKKKLEAVILKSKLRAELKEMEKDLEEMYRRLYAGDEDAASRADDPESAPVTPEAVAHALLNNRRK